MSYINEQPLGIEDAGSGAPVTQRTRGAFASRKWGNEMAAAISAMQGHTFGEDNRRPIVPDMGLITVDDIAPGGGQYRGLVLISGTGLIDISDNVGSDVTGSLKYAECFVSNYAELGLSTHRLTAIGGSTVPPLVGFFRGYAKDGENLLPVYAVYHIRRRVCTT